MFKFSATYTDFYQLTMAQCYFLEGRKFQTATFDYFFRKHPFNGGYAIFAGLQSLLEILDGFLFTEQDLIFLQRQGFNQHFLNYLQDFSFQGDIYSFQEGDIVFPNQPILTVCANIIEAQIVETILLNVLNFQTLIATKASRIRQVAKDKRLLEFGLRRAQGPGGFFASRAAIIGGFDATSNVQASRVHNIPVAGTMAHSFIQSYENELEAFRQYAKSFPHNTTLLVDTYNTLKSGIPNAITVAKEMESQGLRLKGIRLDSGDLAYLSKKARHMLDTEDLQYVGITVSNQLDESVVKSLIEQDAPIDSFGIGTSLAIGYPDAALDGVYKLAQIDDRLCIKISESITKTTLPGHKQVYRLLDHNNQFYGGDVITFFDEKSITQMHHPFEAFKHLNIDGIAKEPLLHKVMQQGKVLSKQQDLNMIAQYCRQRLSQLPSEYKRTTNPHLYKVGMSDALKQKRDQLIEQYHI
ncbi:nicotinate phosphoribosyltransferase [Fastidiosibacter lacustris]|uniref:nicotinate phosphoribosyltransferase n=1 Tax=Fastidiosibacter lacustris TaxID=2056695 RepID=UPI000E3500B7|nr:nicotinate phosphoribosyltransferase [Fastidiosibacter lacustris]